MNFDGFKSVASSNTRRGNPNLVKEQAYTDMKYRRALKKGKDGAEGTLEGRFYVSNARFNEWGLAGKEGNGLRQFTDETSGATVIAVVAKKDSIILKSSEKGKKGKNFKSTRLEAALDKLKVIDATMKEGENQFIALEKVADTATIDGVACLQVYKPVKGEAKKSSEAAAPKAATADAPQAEAPKAEPAPAGAAGGADWD